MVAGRTDGLGCEWFSPRKDPSPPFAPFASTGPYSPMRAMRPEARPLPKILTATERLNFAESVGLDESFRPSTVVNVRGRTWMG